jgi:hypothetical protein
LDDFIEKIAANYYEIILNKNCAQGRKKSPKWRIGHPILLQWTIHGQWVDRPF